MKKTLLLIAFLTSTFYLFSQDVIIRTNGTKINCTVTKIDSVNIYFNMEAKNGLTVSTSLNKSQVQNIDDLKAKFNKEKSKKEYSSGNEQNPDNTTKNANPGKSESSNVLVKIGFGPQIDSPYDNDLSLGVGFGSDLKFLIANCFGIGLNVGYQHLFMADDWADQWKAKWGNKYQNADYRTTQIRGTLTYYFVNSTLNPYLGIEMGVNKIHGHYEYEEYDTGEDYNYWVDDDYTDNHFAYAINGGLEIGLGKTVALDLNLKYNGGDESYVSGKFGLVFNICGN